MDLSKYEIIDLSTDHVDRIFSFAAEEKHQAVYLSALYSAMYGFPVLEREAVNSVDGFAKASANLTESLMDRAQSFDQRHHPNAMPGGLMMNNGPSKAEWLSGMEVAVPPLRLEEDRERQSPQDPHPISRVSPGEARGILTQIPMRDCSDMDTKRWTTIRSDLGVKAQHLAEDAAQHHRTVGMLAEAVKEEIFGDEYRHGDPQTTRELADALRQDGALLWLPKHLQDIEEQGTQEGGSSLEGRIH
jgi:hypothetical protein